MGWSNYVHIKSIYFKTFRGIFFKEYIVTWGTFTLIFHIKVFIGISAIARISKDTSCGRYTTMLFHITFWPNYLWSESCIAPFVSVSSRASRRIFSSKVSIHDSNNTAILARQYMLIVFTHVDMKYSCKLNL